jgi:DNA-binding NarL/FixJ family response regulator
VTNRRSGVLGALSPREWEVARAVAAGHSNHDIAVRFAMSEQTVKNHLTAIFRKTGLPSRLRLAIEVLRQSHPA